MTIRERVPLASLTTLQVGGLARFVAECAREGDVREALDFAKKQNLPWRVLGGGSNVLAQDAGYEGVVLRMGIDTQVVEKESERVAITAGAGVSWDALVRVAAANDLWGIENLAGIPGTVGAAPVQNIGAYGSELRDTLSSVFVYDAGTGSARHLGADECGLEYRESRFKREPNLIILSVTLSLSRAASPKLSYKDLAALRAAGKELNTPAHIGEAVRMIRAGKFPDLAELGTAGSFFKNPIIAQEAYDALRARYGGLPGFVSDHGVKVPLAWILDHVLDLHGFSSGKARLFERQPLVIVTEAGASSKDVDACANEVARRVQEATSITLEREVSSFV